MEAYTIGRQYVETSAPCGNGCERSYTEHEHELLNQRCIDAAESIDDPGDPDE